MEIGKGSIFKSKFFYILIGIVIFTVIGTLNDDGSSVTSETPSPKAQFSVIAKQRFDQIAKDFNESSPGELKSIECADDCYSVVYFHFNTIPNDLQTVVGAQAATFSRFRLDNTGTSNVTVFATIGNQTLLKCSASNGMVKDCK